jgi:predicted deacylase
MCALKRLPVRSLASGAKLDIPVYTIKGCNPHAKRAYIQSSMHGSEVQGNAVIAALLEVFEQTPPEGDVVLVPNANPFAINQKSAEYTLGRFDPTTGENWNRNYWLPTTRVTQRPAWKTLQRKVWAQMASAIRARLEDNLSFGERLALKLQLLTVGADYVIDLHCANISARHLYAPQYAEACARYFQIPLMLSIPNDFGGAMDESVSCAWWTFWHELQAQGYPDLPPRRELPQGYTLELGGHEVISRDAAKRDAAGVLNFLRHKGIVAGRAQKPKSGFVCSLQDYKTIYSRHAGHVDFTATLGGCVAKGGLLAQTLQFGRTASWQPTLAEESCIPVLHHSSAVIHEGSELMKVFTKVRKV